MLKHTKIGFFLILIGIIIFGLYIRFDDTTWWYRYKNLFFYKDKPLYSEYDSFYFARLALDLKDGYFKPGKVDYFRCFPDNSSQKVNIKGLPVPSNYHIPGNFISVIWYYLSKIFHISLEKLTWYLIPILAITVAIPIFLYLKDMGYPVAGLSGAIVTLSAPMYLGRSDLMRLDHDVLNLTLPFLIAYFFFKFFETDDLKKKLIWAILSSLTLNFYFLWYAHSNLNFVLVLMFLAGYAWHTRGRLKKQDLLFIAIVLIPQIWYLYTGPKMLWQQVKVLVLNIKKPTEAQLLFKDFPNIFMSISELQKLSFKEVFTSCIFNFYLGLIGLAGAFLLFLLNLRRFLFILPFFGIGLLAFVSGARFVMYLAPFIGIGLGYLIDILLFKIFPRAGVFTEQWKQEVVGVGIGALFVVFLGFIQRPSIKFTSYPKIYAPLVKDMVYLKENTPKNSAIWTWWDYGYAIQLYARRTTYHDGGSQGTPKTYFIARSFSTKSPDEAWNVISFITNYGLTGIAKFLKSGISAKELLKQVQEGKLASRIKTPVYWIFTRDLVPKFTWINYFGTYNFDTKRGVFESIIVPQRCYRIANQVYNCGIGNFRAEIDLNNGIITFPQGTKPVKEIYYKTPLGLKKKKFFENGYVIEIVKTKKGLTGLFLLNSDLADTMFNKMYILRQYDPRYFELVYDDFPTMVVYKVKNLPGR